MNFFLCLSSDQEELSVKREEFSLLNFNREDSVADGNVKGILLLYELRKSVIERSRIERSMTGSGSFVGVKTFIFADYNTNSL